MGMHIPSVFPKYVVNQADMNPNGQVHIRSLGVTTLLFDDGVTQLLFDAQLTRPGLFKVLCAKLDSDQDLIQHVINDYSIHRLKGIFLSHTHYDHVLDMPAFAHLTGAHVYGSLSAVNIAKGNGVPNDSVHQFAPGQEYQIGDFTVKVIRSQHSPAHFYNNDIGKEITQPLPFPARKKEMTEGGSYDFYVVHHHLRILIHPSYNFIPGELNGVKADVVFLGIGQMGKQSRMFQDSCYKETIGTIRPKLVIPIHWDCFFYPYSKPDIGFSLVEHTVSTLHRLANQLGESDILLRILPTGKEIIL